MFHLLLFKLVNPKTPIYDMFYYQVWKEDKFEIEKILDQKDQNYFIK